MKFFAKIKLLVAYTIICCLLKPQLLFAQDEIDTTFNNRMNYVFGVLEKNRVPNGMLQDYAMEFTNLNAFNGSGLVDSNYVDYTTMSDIYNTLISSRIHTSATGLISPAVWDSLWFTQRQNGIITLSGAFFNYARFRDDAVSAGLLTISNDQFVDRYVSGVWQNPYATQSVFAIAPSTDYYEGKNLQVILPSNVWFTNSGATISNISIDMGDGLGYRTLTPGQSLNVNYSDTGRKEWKFRLTLIGGAILYSHASVLIQTDPYNNFNPLLRTGVSDPETLPVFTASQTYLGIAGQGYITIDYANPDKVLRRPLIVVEGFDAGHITHPERWFGNSNILNSFFVRIDKSGSANLEALLGSNINQYDIIYVDWKIGTDYIQRNAFLLEDIVRWANNNKEPFNGQMQPLVIIGQSMGGLITRWALKDMENHSENHQTRLFISYDSPHLGANVPLGYQYMGRHARSLYLRTGVWPLIEYVQLIRNRVSPFRTLNISNTPAARQMLINWVSDNNQVDNSFHSQWQTDLKNMGYPNQNGIWIAAISNGSECAITQPYTPGASLLNYTGRANTRVLSDMILSFTPLGSYVVSLTSFVTGQPAFLLGFLPGKNEIKFEFSVNAQPFGTSDRLYRGYISYKKTWWWIIPVQVTLTNKNYYANPSTLPYDYYPGGQITDAVNLQSSSFANWLIKYNINATHVQTFSFIPVPSALDIGSGNVTLTNADYLTRYIGAAPPVPPRNTPFQNFITAFNTSNPPINNEEHIDILQRNGDWLAAEINGNHPAANCSFICNNIGITVSGASIICNSPLVFTLNNPPAGTTKIWSATPSGIVSISPSADGTQATLTRISTGYFTLQVAITNTNCGTLVVNSSSIRAGGFNSSDYPISPQGGVCRNTNVYLNTVDLVGATNYQWTWSTSYLTYVSGQGTRFLAVRSLTNIGTAVVTVRVANACDAGGSPAQRSFPINACGSFSFTAAPNPTTDNVLVTAVQPLGASATSADETKIFQIKISDQAGNIKKQYSYLAGVTSTNISLNNLTAGIYNIQAYNGTEWTSRQVVKQ